MTFRIQRSPELQHHNLVQRRAIGMSKPWIRRQELFWVSLLKDCIKTKNARAGAKVHAAIMKDGLLTGSPYLTSVLVNMYAKCGELSKAAQVFRELPVHNVVSWSALIAGYVQCGRGQDALECFARMESQGISPDVVVFTSVLKACGITRDLEKGEQIHNEIVSNGFLKNDIVLGTALVDMYARCGTLVRAQGVLDELPFQDVVSWSTLIAGYAQHDLGDEALNCFKRMQHEGVSPNAITFTSVLKACSCTRAINKGVEIHNEIYSNGLLGRDVMLGNALVDMYAKCGFLSKAQEVLNELPVHDVVTWSALLSAYAQQGLGEESLECFERLQNESLCPNEVTFIGVLMACGNIRNVIKGKQLHSKIINNRLLETDITVGNALVDMYARSTAIAEAQEALHKLPVRDVVSWNGLISGYIQMGQYDEALHSFKQMQEEGLTPNGITFTCILKACGTLGMMKEGQKIHKECINKRLLEKDVVLGTALVDMYAKCGVLERAKEVLEELHMPDVIAWNALMSGYVQKGQGDEALECYTKMERKGCTPNEITFTCILKACGIVGAIDKGEKIHREISEKGMLKDTILGTALVDMYARCGALRNAQQILEELCILNVVSWNALITGFAQQGKGEEAVNCFEQMLGKDLCPNTITFLAVLNACSHAGLVEQGERYYEDMGKKYGISPDLEHHSCMVDLFGRAGHFKKAMGVIKKMPSSDYPPVWGALLGACQKWRNVELGEFAFEQAIQLDVNNDAAYACMINIYAAAGMQEDADKIEAMRVKRKENV